MQFGNFSVAGLVAAFEMLVALLIGMCLREWARARVAARLNDPTPRLWGRVTLNPQAWFEPFGSGLLPGLIAILWAVGGTMFPVAAYAKPPPIDPAYFRRYTRDSILVSFAGPVIDLVVGIGAALVLRYASMSLEAIRAVAVIAWVHCSLFVFHLIPIPGLDGARMLALALPPHPREVYRNGDKYLALWVLLALFVFAFVVGIQQGITRAICDGVAGGSCLNLVTLGN